MELTQFDWLRIRRALLSAANDLADIGSDQEPQYLGTYDAVKAGLVAMYGVDFRNDGNTNTQVIEGRY
jgi:hypothetical protein